MLVQAPGGDFIALFPVHDKTEDASFRTLLVKGAVEVSASWSAAAQAEHSVSLPPTRAIGALALGAVLGPQENFLP